MENNFNEFLQSKNDQIIKAHTIAELAFASVEATKTEIKIGFERLTEKFDKLHVQFVSASLYHKDRDETRALIAKLERELDEEHKANENTRGMMKKWGGAIAVIIFVATMILK